MKKTAAAGDWRATTLGRMRTLIEEAVPGVVEELKWGGTPTWSSNGIICTGETYKKVVKLTFAKGASLADPSRLFNSSLDGNVRRAIDIQEGEEVDAAAFKALVREAAAVNSERGSRTAKKVVAAKQPVAKAAAKKPAAKKAAAKAAAKKPAAKAAAKKPAAKKPAAKKPAAKATAKKAAAKKPAARGKTAR
jgi:hypothetical protein